MIASDVPAVSDTLTPHLKDGEIVIDELNMSEQEIKDIKKIMIVACGSAYHTGVTAKYIFERLARIPVEVDVASEFRYRNPILNAGTLVVIISQSGETADSLAALRMAREQGRKVLAIVNVVGGYLLALKFAGVREVLSKQELTGYIEDLKKLPEQIHMLLSNQEQIQKIASRYTSCSDVFFIGRGIDYAISLEGSLKLKEISYIHSEAYAAGELKHGTISLIEEGTLVISLVTQEELYKKTVSNIVEVKTRGAQVLAITNTGNTDIEKNSDFTLYIPVNNKFFTNSLAVIPLQLLAYYISIGRGCDVDKPRNLAKSVTVE